MRKDQPKLKKQFKELNSAIELLKGKIKHRENVIEYLAEQRKDLQQELLIAKIEYNRLLGHIKPALTDGYAYCRNNVGVWLDTKYPLTSR